MFKLSIDVSEYKKWCQGLPSDQYRIPKHHLAKIKDTYGYVDGIAAWEGSEAVYHFVAIESRENIFASENAIKLAAESELTPERCLLLKKQIEVQEQARLINRKKRAGGA